MNLMNRLLGDVLVKDIDEDVLDTLLNISMLEGTLRDESVGYSTKTRKNSRSVLKLFFEFLKKNGDLNNIPNFDFIKVEINRDENPKEILPYSDSVIDKVRLATLSEKDQLIIDMFLFNCMVGLRPSELIPIRALGYVENSISIDKAVVLGEEKTTKTKKSTRKIVLCRGAVSIIEKHISLSNKMSLDRVFTNPYTEQPWKSVRQLTYALEQVFKKCGLADEYRGIQATRHSFVTKAYNGGMELDQIASYIGHSSVRVLEKHYLHWQSILRGKNEIGKLNSIFA